ncbi:MAG: hypothetical protein EOS28_31385 [Mesorhizobium sp.]|nr:MAG: hypothetical protein EOS28_31385 [Mesorhizobium sp.]
MQGSDSGRFSDRFGYRAPDADIQLREDAPPVIRDAVLVLGYDVGFGPGSMRDIVCGVMLRRPDLGNWSPGNIEGEVQALVDEAPWFRIYDLAEKIHQTVHHRGDWEAASRFQARMNDVFREHGIGWKMEDGRIMVRGSEAFELSTAHAVETMRSAGAPTAANEVHEALKDISRRPQPDVSGSIQHALAALECVAREYTATTSTLGPIVAKLNFPKPLDEAVHKLWGFASEQGRHLREGREPQFEEAELVVTVASALSVYLLRAKTRSEGQ